MNHNSNAFIDAVINTNQESKTKFEIRCFYNEKGAIEELIPDADSSAKTDRKYIVLTDDEYSKCFHKLTDYSIKEEKLVYTPPKLQLWHLDQQNLGNNPFTKG